MAERIRRADVGDLALAVLVAALLIGQVATHGVSGPIWVAVVGGIAGGWLGSLLGEELTSFFVGSLGSVVGIYAGWRLCRDFLEV